MEIQYHNTPDDLVAWNRFLRSRRSKSRLFLFYCVAFLLVVVLSSIAFPNSRFGSAAFFGMLVSIPFMAVLILGLIVLLDGVFSPWLIRMECRREPLAGQLAEIRRLEVTTESLTLATASETLTLSWCKVDEVVEAPEHVFIRFGGNSAVLVPNACFKDASARKNFLETIYRSYNDQP